MLPPGLLRSVNVGVARPLSFDGTTRTTAIDKRPVDGAVRVADDHLGDDEQANRRAHGGPDQAVYAYAADSYAWWSRELDRDLPPGTFGENLTVEGVAVDSAVVGTVWRIGTAVLRLRSPRIPCDKLGLRMGDRDFPARFTAGGRPGVYLAIDEPGELRAGDEITVVEQPDHGFTVAELAAARSGDRGALEAMLRPGVVEHVPLPWVEWASRTLARRPRG